jgi:hypothetical protein
VEFLKFWREFMLSAPDEVESMAVFMRAPEKHWPGEMTNRLIVSTIVAHAGDMAEGEEVLPAAARVGTPIADMVEPALYTTLQQPSRAPRPTPSRRTRSAASFPR